MAMMMSPPNILAFGGVLFPSLNENCICGK